MKTALRAFTFNYINVDEKQFGTDVKRLKVLKELRKKITILKPDKGQGLQFRPKSWSKKDKMNHNF